jgi:superfamily II DNA/RNA helicase
VSEALAPYAGSLGLGVATVVGGRSIGGQARALRAGAEVVVATAGRLADLVERSDCRLDRVVVTVVDEADQMANLGFLPQITALLDQVPPGGQHLLFFATLDRDVDQLVERYLVDPVVHAVDSSAEAVAATERHVLEVAAADKHAAVAEIATRDGRVLLFLETRHAVDRLTQQLLDCGVRAAALHGGKSQAQRSRTLGQFKSGHVTALVATNVAARGIHVDDYQPGCALSVQAGGDGSLQTATGSGRLAVGFGVLLCCVALTGGLAELARLATRRRRRMP